MIVLFGADSQAPTRKKPSQQKAFILHSVVVLTAVSGVSLKLVQRSASKSSQNRTVRSYFYVIHTESLTCVSHVFAARCESLYGAACSLVCTLQVIAARCYAAILGVCSAM
jgi:hypothetical protein